jgi:phosphate transport system substrate-binding protein
VLTNQAGHDAWPIAGATFILVYKHPQDAARLKQVLAFFKWAYADGGPDAEKLTYVPLPSTTVDAIMKSWHDNIDAAAIPYVSKTRSRNWGASTAPHFLSNVAVEVV